MITLTCQTIVIPHRSTTIMNIDWSQANGAPIDIESGAVIDLQENIDGVYRRNLVFRFLRPIQDGMYVCQVQLEVANSNKVFTEMDEYYLEVTGAWCIYCNAKIIKINVYLYELMCIHIYMIYMQ